MNATCSMTAILVARRTQRSITGGSRVLGTKAIEL
jgi:hypothetical protein